MAAKIITIANMKGGVGKTTLTVSLADGLAYARRKQILVIDLDPQINSSQVLWGVESHDVPWNTGENVSSFLNIWRDNRNYSAFDNAIKKNVIRRNELFQPGGRISIFSGAPELRLTERNLLSEITPLANCEAFCRDAIEFILNEARSKYHAIIIDCPPGISLLAEASLKNSDMIIVPVAPTRLASEGIRAFYRFIRDLGLESRMQVFLSRMRNDNLSATFGPRIRQTFATFDNEYKDLLAFANAMDYEPRTPFALKYGNVHDQVVALSNEVAERNDLGDA